MPAQLDQGPRLDVIKVSDSGNGGNPSVEVKTLETLAVRPKTAPPKPAISQLFGSSIHLTFGIKIIIPFTCFTEFCAMNDQPVPELHSEVVPSTSGSGVNEHKVWMIVGKERLELPNTHASLSVAQEKLAKLVLSRLTKR